MKYLLHYIEKRKLLQIFSLITVQQGLTAFGTYALAKAGLSFQKTEEFFMWTFLTVLLFILTPAVNIFVRRIEGDLTFRAYNIFLKDSLFSKQGRASSWQNKQSKDRFLASIGSDAIDYLGLSLFMSMDIYSFILSAVLGVLTLSLTIDMSLLPAFAISALASFLVYRKFSPGVEKKYNSDQTARTDLVGHLLKCWDNVLLNNSPIFNNYLEVFDRKISAARSQSVASATASELFIFSLGVASGLPVLASICWILWHSNPTTQPELLIALLATLPRQLNILGVFRSIFQSLTGLLSVEAKFEVLNKGTVLPPRDLTVSIKPELIHLNQKPIEGINRATSLISNSTNGRYEVRGPNGAGKSTLLLHLNQSLESSIYLPTHPDLMLNKEIRSSKSSGENLLAHIEALGNSQADIILLDEWDANLDEKNLKLVNNQIELLSKTKTVVEVRHRI